MTELEPLHVEATGETVGEAKWHALRELEQLAPGLDKSSVQFEVVSEGERGLLGVGYAPARVVATAEAGAPVAEPPVEASDDSDAAASLRELLGKVTAAVGVRARTGEKDGQLLLSFDDSIDTYLKDAFEPGRWPAGRWAVRMDAQRMAPIARQLSESIGLRVAAPRLFRSARNLDDWIEHLKSAHSVEAAASTTASGEQLRVRIAAK